MAEPVRLVIWDLDDTFWRGTLSEGKIDYLDEHHEVVLELARRGIMSSICSKNDHEPVETLLRERGLWDTFVFPSINWEAKGPRIKALIEAVQLRPESVLLIDDNPMNRHEAAHFVPGLQTADETVIGELLADAACRGKPDPALKRLAQYKLLERRKADETEAATGGGSNHDFLRGSNIRVAIDYDIKANLDRAIELINRTNQLNFTKIRLPEDMVQAREQLLKLVGKTDMIAGVVRVADRYGDYGDAGFFALKRTATTNRLVHFCFSCRTLNMGIETWVYRVLERPMLKVAGSVVSDVKDDRAVIDWIEQVDPQALNEPPKEHAEELAEVHLSGSCDLRPLEHYFAEVSGKVQSALTTFRGGFCIRPDHSVLLRHEIERPEGAFIADCAPLGYQPEDFDTGILDGEGRRLYVFSFMADFNCAVYRHNETGRLISLRMGGGGKDVLTLPVEQVARDPERAQTVVDQLAAKFTYVGRTPLDVFEENLRAILKHISPDMPVYLLLPHETKPSGEPIRSRMKRNKLVRKIARRHPNVTASTLEAFAETPEERIDLNHFDRMVYYRFYRSIVSSQRDWFAKQEETREACTPSAPPKEPVLAMVKS